MLISEGSSVVAANLHEGDELPLATLPIGVPHFLLRLTAVCVERKELSISGEYILRALACGMDSADSLAGFLGMERYEVLLELRELERQFYLSGINAGEKIRLTEKGLAAIAADGLRVAVVRELSCVVNGITRGVVPSPGDLISKRRVMEGILTLPAVPARAPKPQELDLAGVKSAMTLGGAQARALEISRLGRVRRASTLFQAGYLMLRRGKHNAPTFVIEGVVDQAIGSNVGGHPALQALKRSLERHEREVRHQLVNLRPRMRRQGGVHIGRFREVLAGVSAYSRTKDFEESPAPDNFIRAATRLLSEPHWIESVEFNVLFVFALKTVKKRLTVVAPDGFRVFGVDPWLELHSLLDRGVEVELHIRSDALNAIQGGKLERAVSSKMDVVPVANRGDWIGFSWDDATEVVACRRTVQTQMGRCEALFGAVVVDRTEAGTLLNELASSGVPVRVKKRQAKAA